MLVPPKPGKLNSFVSELGQQVGSCRIVYRDPSPFAPLAPLLMYDDGLLVSHDWGVAYVDLSDLTIGLVAQGFDTVRYVQVEGDALYVAGSREGVPSVWTVPTSGGDPSSIGLDGKKVEWFHIHQGVLYHLVRESRDSTTMHAFDLNSGEVMDLLTPVKSIVFAADFCVLPLWI
jgi:hypothetical protein